MSKRPFYRRPGRSKPIATRLLANVEYDLNGGCWLFTGTMTRRGYGSIGVGDRKHDHAHRASWKVFRGDIPAGLFVCHRCDVPARVNPGHLFLGTPKENTWDMWSKGRGVRKNGGTFPAKISDQQVRELRRERAEKGTTYAALAAQFGISQALAYQIVSGNAHKTTEAAA